MEKFFNVYTVLITLVCWFFAVTFLQSGIDKVTNREGNLGWFKSVFESTILGKFITPLFHWITLQEIIVGLYMVVCPIFLFIENESALLYFQWGFIACIFVLIQLFTGQRIAKDYPGASGIIPYIIFAILAFSLFR